MMKLTSSVCYPNLSPTNLPLSPLSPLSAHITQVLMADRGVFQPPESVQSRAHVPSMEKYRAMYEQSMDDPAGFWWPLAKECYWKVLPRKEDTLQYNFDIRNGPVSIKWFAGGVTNISYNALDRIVEMGMRIHTCNSNM